MFQRIPERKKVCCMHSLIMVDGGTSTVVLEYQVPGTTYIDSDALHVSKTFERTVQVDDRQFQTLPTLLKIYSQKNLHKTQNTFFDSFMYSMAMNELRKRVNQKSNKTDSSPIENDFVNHDIN